MKINIFVNISSKYQDVADVFFEQLEKNWDENKFDITLPNRIYDAAVKKKADYYICFLGDAIIGNKIIQYKIEKLFHYMEANKIEYCNLIPINQTKSDSLYRFIRKNEFYGIGFIAFIASYNFIIKEFKEKITDFEFEHKYLKMALLQNKNEWTNRIILNKNIFNIWHGIIKGKWDRKVYRSLKNKSIVIRRSKRSKLSVFDTIYVRIARLSQYILTPMTRQKIKNILKKIGFKFITEV